jgi:uncharacterized OsmC-like protein
MNAAGIKELYGRKASAMSRRPGFARAHGHATVHLGDGFGCDVEEKDRMVRVDQPESEGGAGSGPDPGQLMRASLGACLAMGYRIWGARLDVTIEAVDMEITCEFDARGQTGVSADVAIGWQRIMVDVVIASPEPEDAVRRVVEQADRLSPMLANLSQTVCRVHHLTVVRALNG